MYVYSAKTSKSFGFTVIELVVVTAIIAIISGIGIAQYSKFSRNQKLTQAALTLKNNLRFAQQKAVSSQKPAGCAALAYYGLSYASDSYSIKYNCGAGDVTDTTINLPANITFEASGDIIFPVFDQGAMPLTTGGTLTLTDGTNTAVITVTNTGDISGP